MKFRILCFIKILQPPLGWQNLDRTIAYTRFHRIKGGGGGGLPHPSPPHTPITLVEFINSKIFMNPALCHARSRIHKISSTLSKVIGDGGGGGGALCLRLLFCKLCAMINFSLHHNVLCFSFVVVLYSKYSLYAIIKVVLFNERGYHL